MDGKNGKGGFVMNYKLIAALVALGLVVIFIYQTAEPVMVKHFFWWSFSMSLSLLLFIVLAMGILAGWLMKGFSGRRK